MSGLEMRDGLSELYQVVQQAVALTGPLGIDPLLVIAMFGVAGALDLWTPPPSVEFVTNFWVWMPLAFLALLLKLGRSSKATKPFAETLGALESIGGLMFLLAVLGTLVGDRAPPSGAQATVVGGGLIMMIAFSTLSALIIVRTALDLLIWLSPFPFVDLLFQIAKTVFCVTLVLLAIFAPALAAAINAVILIFTALFIGKAVRTARRALVLAWDLTAGVRRRLTRA